MSGRRTWWFFPRLAVNLVAAYAPAPLWVPGLPGDWHWWQLPLAPIALPLLLLSADETACFAALAACLACLVGLTALTRERWAAAAGALFAASLAQGVLFAVIAVGLSGV